MPEVRTAYKKLLGLETYCLAEYTQSYPTSLWHKVLFGDEVALPLIRNTIIFLETGFFKNYKPGDSTYHALFQHAKDQEIILCASGLGLWEWRSQKVNQLEGVVNTIRNSLNKYFQESPIAETVLSREIYQYLPNWDSLYTDSKPYVDGFASGNKIKVYLPIERHINGTWEAYFRGDPPFKSPKNKDDIFDAFLQDKETGDFEDYLRENCYDLHYAEKDEAAAFSFGIGNMWRIAVEYPNCPVPPCLHRAPKTIPGRPPRLLLIS